MSTFLLFCFFSLHFFFQLRYIVCCLLLLVVVSGGSILLSQEQCNLRRFSDTSAV